MLTLVNVLPFILAEEAPQNYQTWQQLVRLSHITHMTDVSRHSKL